MRFFIGTMWFQGSLWKLTTGHSPTPAVTAIPNKVPKIRAGATEFIGWAIFKDLVAATQVPASLFGYGARDKHTHQ